jgi:hypothetical protein
MAIMSCRSGLEPSGDIAACTAFEGLEDDHAAAAAGAEMRECLRLTVAGAVGITRLILWCWHVEQLPRSCDVVGASGIGEETVMTDAMEAGRQHVDEEAADELVSMADMTLSWPRLRWPALAMRHADP